jgi:hypothetical protein
MPPPKGYVRKIITVPPEIAALVRELRFEMRLESDVEAYRMLIQKGLKAFEAEQDAEQQRAKERKR